MLMPGVYDIEAATLTMRPWITVQGSGRLATRIVGRGYSVVEGANAELRNLSVVSHGALGFSNAANGAHVLDVGFTCDGACVSTSASLALEDVAIIAAGRAIEALGADRLALTNVSIDGGGTGDGLSVLGGVAEMRGSSIVNVSNAVHSVAAAVTIDHSTIQANAGQRVAVDGTSPVVIVGSKLGGSLAQGAGQCLFSYDASTYSPLDAACNVIP
jgi:hypothetical protein